MFINKMYGIDRASKKSFECDMYKEHNDIYLYFGLMYIPLLLACPSENADSNDTTAEILYKTPYIDRHGDGISEEKGDCDESDPWPFLGYDLMLLYEKMMFIERKQIYLFSTKVSDIKRDSSFFHWGIYVAFACTDVLFFIDQF